jgi:hypothetical protein
MEISAVGLCARCQQCRIVRTARGSTFCRCARAEVDPDFTRYPRLPVLRCAGYEPKVEQQRDE